MNRILLIEDDDALGKQVVDYLQRAGFETLWWRNGKPIDREDAEGISLVVLDLMLPNMSGMDILREFRRSSDLPVLVLSARQDSRDKVEALRLGADDYVTKPFSSAELVERVKARLRRPSLTREGALVVGGLTMQTIARRAVFRGRPLQLTRAEFDLLLALARRRDRPVERGWLLQHVLDPDRQATQRTLDVHISRIRKKIGSKSIIKTVWGIGYRFMDESA